MDELPPAPFERRIVGPHGAILLQMNNAHAKLCAQAIQRRTHPAWSQLQCDFRVAA